MGFKRLIAGAVAAMCAILFVASPVGAQDGYETPTAEATVQGEGLVRVSGSGCPPNAEVDITIRTDADNRVVGQATVTATADGTFEAVIDTGSASGPATATIVCGDVVQTLGVNLTPATGGAAPLPKTGDDTTLPLAQIAVVLVGLGGVAIYAANKRKRVKVSS